MPLESPAPSAPLLGAQRIGIKYDCNSSSGSSNRGRERQVENCVGIKKAGGQVQLHGKNHQPTLWPHSHTWKVLLYPPLLQALLSSPPSLLEPFQGSALWILPSAKGGREGWVMSLSSSSSTTTCHSSSPRAPQWPLVSRGKSPPSPASPHPSSEEAARGICGGRTCLVIGAQQVCLTCGACVQQWEGWASKHLPGTPKEHLFSKPGAVQPSSQCSWDSEKVAGECSFPPLPGH